MNHQTNKIGSLFKYFSFSSTRVAMILFFVFLVFFPVIVESMNLPSPSLQGASEDFSFRLGTNFLDLGLVPLNTHVSFNVSLTNLADESITFHLTTDPFISFSLSFPSDLQVPGKSSRNITFSLLTPSSPGIYMTNVWVEPVLDSSSTGGSSIPRGTITLAFSISGVYVKSFTIPSVSVDDTSSFHAIIANVLNESITLTGNITIYSVTTSTLLYQNSLPSISLRAFPGGINAPEAIYNLPLPHFDEGEYRIQAKWYWSTNSSSLHLNGSLSSEATFYVEKVIPKVTVKYNANAETGFQLIANISTAQHVPLLLQGQIELVNTETSEIVKSFNWAEYVQGESSFTKLIRADKKGSYQVQVELHYDSFVLQESYDYYQAINIEPSLSNPTNSFSSLPLIIIIISLSLLFVFLLGFMVLKRKLKHAQFSLELLQFHVMLQSGEGLLSINLKTQTIEDMPLRMVARVYQVITATELQNHVILPINYEDTNYYLTRIDSLIYVMQVNTSIPFNDLNYLPSLKAFILEFHRKYANMLSRGLVDVDITEIMNLAFRESLTKQA